MNKAIAVTQQGDKALFLIGDYQATLRLDGRRMVWFAEYFKKNRKVLASNAENHPVMPNTSLDQPRAEAIVRKVIGCLHAGMELPKIVHRPKSVFDKTRRRVPKADPTARGILEHLLELVDGDWTPSIPVGKKMALLQSKVRICDQHGDVVCEIPYPVYEKLLKDH